MMSRMRALIFFSAVLGPGLASGQSSEELVIREVRRAASALKVNLGAHRLTAERRADASPAGSLWVVSLDESYFMVTDRTYRFLSYTNLRKLSDLRDVDDSSTRLIKTVDEGVREADLLLARMGVADLFPFYGEIAGPDGTRDPNKRGLVTVGYEARPHGFRSYGSGNNTSLRLDLRDGSVAQAIVVTTWTYGEPDVQLSGQEASYRATGVIGGNIDDLELRYVAPNDWYGSEAGADLKNRRISRLAYVATSQRKQCYIDSQSGLMIGGHEGPASTRSLALPASSSRIQLENTRPLKARDTYILEFMKRANLEPSRWDGVRIMDLRGVEVVYMDKGRDNSTMDFKAGKLRIVDVASFIPPTPSKSLRTEADVKVRFRSLFGDNPSLAKPRIDFYVGKKGGYPKWTLGRRMARIRWTDKKGKVLRQAIFDAATGQLQSYFVNG